MSTLHIPIILVHEEVEVIFIFASMFDTGEGNFWSMFGWIKLFLFPLSIRACPFFLSFKIVQTGLLSPL